MTPSPAAAKKLPIGQRIVWARKRKGISQERLAIMVGTSRRHMIRLEKGAHRPGPVLRAKIAEATEQPEEFFDGDGDDDEGESDLPSFDEFLRRRIRQLLAEAQA